MKQKDDIAETSKRDRQILNPKSLSKNLGNENIYTLCFQKVGILDHVLS